MNKIDKINAIEDYFQNVIKKSWTWEKLTELEKRKFMDCNFDWIKGNTKQRQLAISNAYDIFLAGIGYTTFNWREQKSVSVDEYKLSLIKKIKNIESQLLELSNMTLNEIKSKGKNQNRLEKYNHLAGQLSIISDILSYITTNKLS